MVSIEIHSMTRVELSYKSPSERRNISKRKIFSSKEQSGGTCTRKKKFANKRFEK